MPWALNNANLRLTRKRTSNRLPPPPRPLRGLSRVGQALPLNQQCPQKLLHGTPNPRRLILRPKLRLSKKEEEGFQNEM